MFRSLVLGAIGVIVFAGVQAQAPEIVPMPKVCVPKYGDTREQVIEQCGKPLAVYEARNSSTQQVEYDYGGTIVGFYFDRVVYVLTLRPER